jgi:hypothetical protein
MFCFLILRNVYKPFEYAKRQAEVAADNELKVIDGKIPLPDLRIECETAQMENVRVERSQSAMPTSNQIHPTINLSSGLLVR